MKDKICYCISTIVFILLMTAKTQAVDLSVWGNESQPIKFYGKVVDLEKNPIPDAKIIIRMISYIVTPAKIITQEKLFDLKSDANGRFSLGTENKLKGASLYVKEVSREGYEWRWNYAASNRYFEYRKGEGTPVNIPDVTNPSMFFMRKKGENPTYLIKQGENKPFEIKIAPGEDSFYSFIDLSYIWREKIQEEGQKYEKDFLPLPGRHDFKVTGVYDKDKSEWRVTFTAAGENGGFILDDKFLDTAPADGYQKEFTFTQPLKTRELEGEIIPETTESTLKDKYLYVKSRDTAIYTRIKFKNDYARADFNKFTINAETATNPYGERNLEFDDELPYQIISQFEKNIAKSFLKGQPHSNPDIKQIMDEFKKTHKRVKNQRWDIYEWIEIE